MSATAQSDRLREALAGRRLLSAAGACDPFSAQIIARAGCEAVYLGGNAMAVAQGVPQPLLTLDMTVECASRVARSVDVPVIVDLGSGFGEPAHVHRAVRDLEMAGANAFHLDDQPYPKRFGYHRAGGEGGLVPSDVAAARLRAASAARRDTGTIMIARTDALRQTGDVEAAIERGRRYAEAGADALMILDLAPEQAKTVRLALPDLPLVWIGGVTAPVPSTRAIEEAGFAIALYPFNTIAAIGSAVAALWRNFTATGEIAQDAELLGAMRGELQRIVGIDTYWEIEDQMK
ncbi:MAG: carboxyvinyl-carboxyphosphonate phosphorylmutase [Bradyrhizobium sp.]|nr:carboxyvinyl-carboxyphosphonate phosphorylmutase [Bradyrhizobium sp.]